MTIDSMLKTGWAKVVVGVVLLGMVVAIAMAPEKQGGEIWIGFAAFGAYLIVLGLIQIFTGKNPHEGDE